MRASHALGSKHHFHHHRRDHWYLAAGFAHLRGVEKTIATTASTAATSAPTASNATAHSANATENRRGTRPGILGSAGPAGGSSATAENTAAHANSTATNRTSPATGIDATLRETGIPHLAGGDKENRGVATAHENCAACDQARYCSIGCSARSQRAGCVDRTRASADRCRHDEDIHRANR